uniref:NADH-ubiquinone oxidoreductase chain 4L n=1 Tax=Malcus inconspicuus TaxID=498929 RepID=B7SMG2_9HEMI|nr:NADH dehydrogenase subunit 4L [Malcus inconspicuus]ABZ02056.1 NADH dehydrogenase subunit 4L [Malcus inconspicuus]
MVFFKLSKLIIMMMFMSGVLSFCMFRNHILNVLFSLEYLVVTVFFVFYLYLLMMGYDLYYILIYLVFSVCEGALGLGVLVNMICMHGNDYLSSFFILSW